MSQLADSEAFWETKLAELAAYKEEHGRCNVPRTYEANKERGRWVVRQRTEYHRCVKGETSSMTEERIAKL